MTLFIFGFVTAIVAALLVLAIGAALLVLAIGAALMKPWW